MAEKKHTFCPKIEPTNNNMMSLSNYEKLNMVELEVQSLYEFCLERSFTTDEIYNCVSKLYGPQKSFFKKAFADSMRPFFILSGILGLIAMLLMEPQIYSLSISHAKIFSVKFILPYWDWASLYDEDCMISNHWLPLKVLNYTEESCRYCHNIKAVPLNNLTHSFVTDMITENDAEPLVVNDTMKDWGNLKKLTIDEIVEIYQHHPGLSNTLGSCVFRNNAGFNDMFYDFFNAYAANKLPSEWHASWVNCEIKAVKVIRQYQQRPYFFPPMMQMGIDIAVIVSSGMNANQTFTVPDTSSEQVKGKGRFITVLSGSLKFTLKPPEDCSQKFGCKNLDIMVSAGETMFYIDEPWESYYTCADPGITVAVANIVIWDDVN